MTNNQNNQIVNNSNNDEQNNPITQNLTQGPVNLSLTNINNNINNVSSQPVKLFFYFRKL